MSSIKPIHMLVPGQELSVRWRDASGLVLERLKKMKLTGYDGGNPSATVWAAHVDQAGVSFYIVRGYAFGGDMEMYMPQKDVMWQSYFEPLGNNNQSYVKSAHFSNVFPDDFI